MNTQTLLQRFDLEPQHAYLLELIPLIEMIWADGRNQSKEIAIIEEITQKHVAELNHCVEGITVISTQDARDFLNRFLHVRPSESLLSELRDLTVDWLTDKGEIRDKGQSIIAYCLDIAAACAATNKFDDRIVEQEKLLLKELAEALDVLGG